MIGLKLLTPYTKNVNKMTGSFAASELVFRAGAKMPTQASQGLFAGASWKGSKLKQDLFIHENLPVLNCVGSFNIGSQFRKSILELSKKEILNLKFGVNSEAKTVTIKENPKLAMAINGVIKKIPEFFYVFRPKTNEPDLANHLLSTYLHVLKHPDFSSFSPRNQIVLQHAALLHDVGKALDSEPTHAGISVRILNNRLSSANLPKDDGKMILKLIEHHHYCYNIKAGLKTYEDYAKIFSEKDFKMLKLLGEADLSSKEVNMKNMGRILENKTIFMQQARVYEKTRRSNIA